MQNIYTLYINLYIDWVENLTKEKTQLVYINNNALASQIIWLLAAFFKILNPRHEQK